jgi:Rap guanine nucleotide exchange factor 4
VLIFDALALHLLAVYLKDLLFTQDGNKTFINKLINLEKFKMISNQVRQITALSTIPYEGDDSPKGLEARQYIKNPIVIPDIMKLSQMCSEHNQ